MSRFRRRYVLLAFAATFAVTGIPVLLLGMRSIHLPILAQQPTYNRTMSPRDGTGNDASPRVFSRDFGNAKETTPLFHRFQVKNDTNVPWTLKSVEPRCRCAAALASNDPVKPGRMFDVKVRFTPPEEEGPRKSEVVVHFEEQEAPTLVFEVQATTVHDFSVAPQKLSFNPLARGSDTSGVIDVFNNSAEPWDGLHVKSDQDWLNTSIHEVTDEPLSAPHLQHWQVKVIIASARLSFGAHAGRLTLSPKSSTHDPKEVTVSAVIEPALKVMPSEVFLGELGPREQRDFSLVLRFSADAYPEDRLAVRLNHDLGSALTYEMSQPPHSTGWIVRCRLNATDLTAVDGYVRGSLRIHPSAESRNWASIVVPLIARIVP